MTSNQIKELERTKYTEYISQTNAYKILQNWTDILKSFPEKRKIKIENEEKKNKDPLIFLKKIVKMKSDIIHTNYLFSKKLEDNGRLFANGVSLQQLPREIRNCIANNQYYDLDMVNCHQQALSQYCRKNNIDCKKLDEYNLDPKKYRQELLTSNPEYDMEESKKQFLKILNGGESNANTTFFKEYKKEMLEIHKKVIELNKDEYNKIKKKEKYNPDGKMVNIILCRLEHMILMNAVYFMKNKGFSVDVLVFDGLMIRKNKELTKEILAELNKYISNKTEYNMYFVEKEMVDYINLSKYPDPIDNDQPINDYYDKKEDFEKKHLKIIHPSMYLSYTDDNKEDFEIQKEQALISSYRHLKYNEKDKNGISSKKSFITNWLNDEHIRHFQGIVFIPTPKSYDLKFYNTWSDFNQESVPLIKDLNVNDNEYVKRFNEFIFNLLGENESSINFFISWCANIIQNPAYRCCVCLVLYSLKEGVGKNQIIRTLELCLGEKYVNYISDVGNQLFGKHSSAEMFKLLIVLNECKGKDTYSNTDIFKTRITDDKREVELKNQATIQMVNYCSYIINTNNLLSVNAGDKDRRFCVLNCDNKMINDKIYYKKYHNDINENPQAIRSIYEYLKNWDIKKHIPNYLFADNRPFGDAYNEIVKSNRDTEYCLLEDIVYKNWNTEMYNISSENLWLYYKRYCDINNHNISNFSKTRFCTKWCGTIMKDVNEKCNIDNLIIENKRSNQGKFYIFNIQKLKVLLKLEKNDSDLYIDEDSDEIKNAFIKDW